MKLSCQYFLFYLFLSISLANTAIASDHVDGPITAKHRVADLTDFYVFPAPENKRLLSIIVNSYPLVSRKEHFSDRVIFRITIKQASIDTQKQSVKLGNTMLIDCQVRATPETAHAHEQEMHCYSEAGLNVLAQVNASPEKNQTQYPQNTAPIFAGERLDPFFFNADWAITASSDNKIPKPAKLNTVASTNILSIALQLDIAKFFAEENPTTYVAAVESLTRDNEQAAARQIDRIGRAEITNVTIVAPKLSELRDLYNQTATFAHDLPHKQTFVERLQARIEYYDELDQQKNWSTAESLQLAELFERDFLIVDMSKPCEADAFLDIEKALLKKVPHKSCGGRKLTDDIIDKLYTFYINKGEGKIYGDGIDRASKPPQVTFPYLNSPARGLWPCIKAWIAKKVIY